MSNNKTYLYSEMMRLEVKSPYEKDHLFSPVLPKFGFIFDRASGVNRTEQLDTAGCLVLCSPQLLINIDNNLCTLFQTYLLLLFRAKYFSGPFRLFALVLWFFVRG